MDFQDFINSIPKIVQQPLLGENAHQIMSPPERLELLKNLDLNSKNPRKAAVLMLLYPKNNQMFLVLILRNSYPGVHSSQVAFPGGKFENFDANFEETALRETFEEVGIAPTQITIIKSFSEIYIPPSNFMVYPFLGFSNQELTFIPDIREVAGIIELPIKELLDDELVVFQKITTSYSNEVQVPSFKIKEYLVWGATAMMLNELKETLKKVL